MSVASFPRAEHIALLRQKIQEGVRQRGLALEVAERGLNQMKCQYRFGLRRAAGSLAAEASEPDSSGGQAGDWVELAIHFQVAQRMEESGSTTVFERILEDFLSSNFP